MYNMRSGFTITLNPIAGGLFQFNADKFFPLAINNGGKPCNSFPNRTLDCSNGGKSFPLAQKIASLEDSSQQFSFTSEHHSFFQLRGTESFNFSGVSFKF